MKGVEELECTTVATWSWNLLGALWHVLWTITWVYHIERSVFELSRKKDMISIQFTRPLNQIEQTKNIRIEKNQMFSLNVSRKTSGTRLECFIFERVRLSLVIERSGTLYRKTRVEQNRPLIQRWNTQGDLNFCIFPTMEPVCNSPVSSGQFSKSRIFALTNAIFVTCIRRPPLLRGS